VALAPDPDAFSTSFTASGATVAHVYAMPETAFVMVFRDYTRATSAFKDAPTAELASLILILTQLFSCTEDEYKRSPMFSSKLYEGYLRYYSIPVREAYAELAASYQEMK
jgi:hypothetical protein